MNGTGVKRMTISDTLRKSAAGIKVKEVLIIILVGCCLGLAFNLFWKNKIPFIAPSKAELYRQKNIPTVTLQETKERYERGGYIFLDARNCSDFEPGHIKGALNLPVSSFELYYPRLKDTLPKTSKIVVYCEGIECGASLHLAQELAQLKYEFVEVFLGGWLEWNQAGYPAE